MTPKKILSFIIFVFILLGIMWFLFPKEGIKIELHFPSLEGLLAKTENDTTETNTNNIIVDSEKTNENKVDSLFDDIEQKTVANISASMGDSIMYYKNLICQSPYRIYLPNGDYHFFDSLLYLFEHAKENKKLYRIHHFGDSQIEMDRISSVFRQTLQETFGGNGPGLLPPMQSITSVSVVQTNYGNLNRYLAYGDASMRNSHHNRYGVMAQVGELTDFAVITIERSSHRYAQKNVKNFSKVSLLVGNCSDNFFASFDSGDGVEQIKYPLKKKGLSLLQWKLSKPTDKGILSLDGSGELYAIALDGNYGVALDNAALRGSSGTIFTRIDADLMKESFKMLNTKLIILQFGGNMIPTISSEKDIKNYMGHLERQFNYFKKVAPKAKMLFIGPSDMSRRIKGILQTRPYLPEVNEAIKQTALKNGVAFWDMYTVMGGKNSMIEWVNKKPNLAGSDYIHFTQLGAKKIGEVLSRSFLQLYDFYLFRQRLCNDSIVNEYFDMP